MAKPTPRHWLALACAAAVPAAIAAASVPPPVGWTQGPHRVSLGLDLYGVRPDGLDRLPVFVLLDGEQYGDRARSIARELVAAGRVRSILLVSVQIDASADQLRLARLQMFTTSVAASDLPERARNEGARTGEVQLFAANLRRSLNRLLQSSRADRRCMTLFGHSLAGHASVAIGLDRPGDWRGLVAASPSLWWGREALLRDPRLNRRPGHRPHLLLTAGALEASGDAAQRFHIIANARAFEQASRRRFASTELIVFPGADHQSSVDPALRYSLVRAGQCWRRG